MPGARFSHGPRRPQKFFVRATPATLTGQSLLASADIASLSTLAAIETVADAVNAPIASVSTLAATATVADSVSAAIVSVSTLDATASGAEVVSAAILSASSLAATAIGDWKAVSIDVGRVPGFRIVLADPTAINVATATVAMAASAAIASASSLSANAQGGSVEEQTGSGGGSPPRWGLVRVPQSQPKRLERSARPTPKRRPLVVLATAIDDQDALVALYAAGAIDLEEFAALIAA